jgi:hypothetical protein
VQTFVVADVSKGREPLKWLPGRKGIETTERALSRIAAADTTASISGSR